MESERLQSNLNYKVLGRGFELWQRFRKTRFAAALAGRGSGKSLTDFSPLRDGAACKNTTFG